MCQAGKTIMPVGEGSCSFGYNPGVYAVIVGRISRPFGILLIDVTWQTVFFAFIEGLNLASA